MTDITIGAGSPASPLRGSGAAGASAAPPALGGRAVEVAPAPSSRLSFLKSLSQHARDLFGFKARRAEAARPAVSDALAQTQGGSAAQDALALCLKRGFRPEDLLKETHKSAVIESRAQGAAKDYQKNYLAAIAEGLEGVKDRDLLRLHAKMNGKAAHGLRAALHRAGEPGNAVKTDRPPPREKALGLEMQALSKRMEDLDLMVRIEMKRRDLGDRQKAPMEMGKEVGGSEAAEKLLQSFAEAQLSKISAGEGDVPQGEREKIEEDFRLLAKEAPLEAAPEDHSDPDSPPLAVTETYLTDAIRQDVQVEVGGQSRPLLEARDGSLTRREISNALLNLCGGNRDQALRLSHLLNQKAIAPIFLMTVNGSLIPNPYGAAAEGGFIDGEKDKSFALRREADGAMRIHFQQIMNPQFTNTLQGEMLPLDDKKSRIMVEYEARLPARQSAPAEILALRYQSHLSIGESARALP